MPHTDAECARRLLAIFHQMDVKAGESLHNRDLAVGFTLGDWTIDDLDNGLVEAARQRWVVLDSGGILLTSKGAAEIVSSMKA